MNTREGSVNARGSGGLDSSIASATRGGDDAIVHGTASANRHQTIVEPFQFQKGRRGRMKAGLLSGILAAFAVGLTPAEPGPDSAQDSQAAPAAPARSPRPAVSRSLTTPAPLLEALDSDHDGVISEEEIDDASAALETLDKNGDHRLTREEYLTRLRTWPLGRRPGFPGRSATGPLMPPPPMGGLVNFAMVDQHLFRGAQPSATGIQTLKSLGVTTIIDLKLPERVWLPEKGEAERNGILYTNMPMAPSGRPVPEQVNAVLSAITNAPGRVYLHCQAGKDRTGTIAACYRILEHHWTSEQALREAVEFRMASNLVEMKQFVIDFAKTNSTATLGSTAPEAAVKD